MTIPYSKEKEETIDSFVRFANGHGMPDWPMEIFLEVSNVCNLRCAMCNTFSAISTARKQIIGGLKRGFMDIADITSTMEPLLIHALQVHAFGFGEPTIHPHFREIIDHLSKFGVMVDFFTNGMRLDDEMCAFLVDQNVAKVTLSMSGATKLDYESIYIGGDFEKVISGLKRLHRLKIQQKKTFPVVEVNSLAFMHHVEKFLDFVELMGECGVSCIYLKPLSTFDYIMELHGHISIPRKDIELPMLERAREIAKKYGMTIASKPYEQLAFVSSPSEAGKIKHRGRAALSTKYTPLAEIAEIARNRHADGPSTHLEKQITVEYLDPTSMERVVWDGVPCLEPFKTFYVTYNGEIYPCCFKPNTKISFGSLKREPGEAIWRNQVFTTMREDIVRQSAYPSIICGGCLKAQVYPQAHPTMSRVAMYHRWCMEAYGKGLSKGVLEKVKTLRSNREILAAQRAHTE